VVAGSAECTALGVPRQYVDPHDQQPGWTSNLGAQHPRNPERNAPPSARPKVVDTAFWLWNAAVAFSLVSIPVALADEATMSEKLARNAAMRNRPLSPAATSEVVGMMRVGIMVFMVVIALIWLLSILKMRAGRSWARTLLAGFGARRWPRC
jgi:hypothetical protein